MCHVSNNSNNRLVFPHSNALFPQHIYFTHPLPNLTPGSFVSLRGSVTRCHIAHPLCFVLIILCSIYLEYDSAQFPSPSGCPARWEGFPPSTLLPYNFNKWKWSDRYRRRKCKRVVDTNSAQLGSAGEFPHRCSSLPPEYTSPRKTAPISPHAYIFLLVNPLLARLLSRASAVRSSTSCRYSRVWGACPHHQH